MTGYIARQLLRRGKKRKISEKHKRSEKSKRSKYYNYPEYNPDDRMSKLPEEIVVKILGSLPLKEAAATSILSKRWRYLWISSTTDLDFDGHPFFKPLFNVDLIPPLVGGASVVKRQRQKYMDWVNSVINQLKSNSSSSIHIHRFRIDFVMTDSFSSSIDNWVKFALTKSVQILDLNLLEVEDLRVTQNYHLHEKLFCDNAAAALRVLRLRGINISGMVVEHLLSKCPYLEELRVDHSLTLTHLRILGGPLKHLELSNCDKIISVEIHDALNLVSFHCVYLQNFFDDHPTLRLVVRNVPKLVDVYLYSSISASFDRVFTTLSYACLSQLQILELDLSDQQNYVENPVYPMLTNLKHLKLHLNTHLNFLLLQIIPFLKVSPYLHTLELKILYYWGSRTALGEVVDRPRPHHHHHHHHHHHLKEVKIIGYTGESEPNEDELILFLIKNAVSMEKLIIDACIFRSWPPSRYPKMILKDARDHALQHLKDKIPSTVEFICL